MPIGCWGLCSFQSLVSSLFVVYLLYFQKFQNSTLLVFFFLTFQIYPSSPVLLEGSPGVGKTSLIVALGKFSGHKVVRINLSEQVSSSQNFCPMFLFFSFFVFFHISLDLQSLPLGHGIINNASCVDWYNGLVGIRLTNWQWRRNTVCMVWWDPIAG